MSHRNFGLPNATSPTTVGGNQSPGSHYSADTRADTDSLTRASSFLGAPNSRADDFNLGAGLLFLVVFFGSVAVVGGVAFAYLTFAPKPAEYLRDVEAYRLKGH